VRLSFIARPRGSGESMIAVELADDLDDAIDGLEFVPSAGVCIALKHTSSASLRRLT
jgi:hypothetical protein